MATVPLQIEWLPQPIQISEDKKVMIIKDPLPVIAILLDFNPPSNEDRAEHAGPRILEEFWLLIQHFLRIEINEQLNQIHDMAIRYQEANTLQIRYLQQAVYNMTIHMFDVQNAMIVALNNMLEIVKDCTDLMDWEWTPDLKPVANLATDPENKIWKGKIKLTLFEGCIDAVDREARSRRGGTVPPPTPKGSLGSSQNTGRKGRTTLTSKQGNSGGAPPKKLR